MLQIYTFKITAISLRGQRVKLLAYSGMHTARMSAVSEVTTLVWFPCQQFNSFPTLKLGYNPTPAILTSPMVLTIYVLKFFE